MLRIKTTVRQLRRSPYQATAVLMVMTFTMLVLSAFLVLTIGLSIILKNIEGRPQLLAYFDEKITPTEEQIATVEQALKKTGHLASTTYVSKEKAFEIYKKLNEDKPQLLEQVSPSTLPASIDISATDPGYLNELAEIASKQPGIKQVTFQKDIVERLITWTNAIRKGGLVIVGVLTLTSILIVVMVTGMRIAIRREEVSIMQLVGGSRWFIRWPFILEGILYGAISSTIAVFLTSGILLWYSPQLSNFFGDVRIFPIPLPFLLAMWVGVMMFGILIGVIGASISLWRYLKT